MLQPPAKVEQFPSFQTSTWLPALGSPGRISPRVSARSLLIVLSALLSNAFVECSSRLQRGLHQPLGTGTTCPEEAERRKPPQRQAALLNNPWRLQEDPEPEKLSSSLQEKEGRKRKGETGSGPAPAAEDSGCCSSVRILLPLLSSHWCSS